MAMESCPGCGVQLPATDSYAPDHYNASAACWQIYGELSAYTLTYDDSTFLHQHAVDAYAAQHASGTMRPITVTFALIGLFLAVERGWTGRQVQRAHQLLAARSKEWPRFTPPGQAGDVMVADVMRAQPGTERAAALKWWSAAVWDAWRAERGRVEALVSRFLDEER